MRRYCGTSTLIGGASLYVRQMEYVIGLFDSALFLHGLNFALVLLFHLLQARVVVGYFLEVVG